MKKSLVCRCEETSDFYRWARDETSSSALAVAPPSLKPRHRLQVARVIRRPHRYHQRHSRSHTPRWPRCWWPGLCLDGALHGEVDARHRTRSHLGLDIEPARLVTARLVIARLVYILARLCLVENRAKT